ncbi:MAG: FliA/WhiG family RNA polymerase sigma factor [Armatimonadetes bacterium]|jgi:RNA polymerase sigma factor for flagellar operon FliA|nr:FliA/WhiG family RNA polymerase sigma factor [Armatimonadota bacterium]
MMRNDTRELWVRYKLRGDAEAREALILAYTPLVRHVVDRLNISPTPYLDRDDLETQAIIGLIDAIEKCDLQRWEQFEAYATLRMRGAVIDGIREMDWVPRLTRRTAGKLEATRARLAAALGRAPTDQELAEALQIDPERVQGILAAVGLGTVLSLDEPFVAGEGDSLSLLDTLAHPDSPDPEANLDRLARREALTRAIVALPPDERLVITLYYYEDLTLKEISQVLERTEARVCQIHRAALRRIRSRLLGRDAELFIAA